MSGRADGWELAGAVRLAPVPERWVNVNGWDEPDAVGLNFIVQHPDDPELLRRVSVRFPIHVDTGGDLIIGEPEFVEEPR